MTDEQISAGEVPVAKRQEEKAQEQNRGIEQVQEESRISKSKQKSADTVEYKNGFVMRGNISVTDGDTSSQQRTTGNNPQAIGLLMVTTEDLAQHTQICKVKAL